MALMKNTTLQSDSNVPSGKGKSQFNGNWRFDLRGIFQRGGFVRIGKDHDATLQGW